jgi:membrane-associated phospholipid phosphatase
VGEHFPLDVVGGAVLGAVGAGGMLLFRDQVLKWWPAGASPEETKPI